MNDDLFFLSHASNQPISIGISACKQDLEEKHGGRPNCGRATKPGQDELADHRLNLKEKECREENAGGEEEHGEKLLTQFYIEQNKTGHTVV